MELNNLVGKNVYWFLIDGLSPDHLNICNEMVRENNFIDDIIKRGIVFSNVACTNGGTHTSMHSIFSSMYSSVNGATGWAKEALRKFNPEIFTITDYFKEAGYETYRYCDAHGERTVPMSGFDIWESSGYLICDLLKKTDMTNSKRREEFINLVNKSNNKKFVYHHCLLLHELNSKLGNTWKSEDYRANIKIVGKYFEQLFKSYNINDEDIVIISSDHGVTLDIEWSLDGLKYGERQYEMQIKTLFAISSGLTEFKKIDNLISSIDEGPTLIDLVLEKNMIGQGESRKKLIERDIYDKHMVYREKGSFCVPVEKRSPLFSDLYYVRDDNWKYVYGINDERCEWLINLNDDKDYEKNLKNLYPEKVVFYKRMLERTLINPSETVETIYKKNKMISKASRIKYIFSIIVENEYVNDDILNSLLDIAGPYYEIIILHGKQKDNNYKVKYLDYGIVDICEKNINGKYVVFLTGKNVYSEYFLSDLYRVVDNEKCKYIFKGGFCLKKDIFMQQIECAIKEIDIRCINNEDTIKYKKYEKKFIVFGCGNYGEKIYKILGDENIYCFADNKKTGSIHNKKIINIDELYKIQNDYEVIIGVSELYEQEIKKQLNDKKIACITLETLKAQV